ncbi:MAG: hypothetical protein JWL76_1988 [Thermoleophilia bacterium]|nr:hypothetical protein [Thermoleophilia bacterium]
MIGSFLQFPRTAYSVFVLCAGLSALLLPATATAATARVPLATADAFATLAGSTITNTGNSVLNGELGLHPGTAVTGFPPGLVNGAQHVTDAVALQAKADLTAAYLDAAGRAFTAEAPKDLGGSVLVPGVYRTGSVPSLHLTGNVTLDAQGDANAVFIFQVESTFITATDSSVSLINGAQSCNVYWQVGSSATIGTRTSLRGNVLALTSISVQDAATIDGRLLARNGAVTLINDTITRAQCAAGTTGVGGDEGGGDNGGGAVGGGNDNDNDGGGLATTGPDRTGPIMFVSHPRPGAACTTRDFTTSISTRDRAGIRRVDVFLDGRRLRTTRLTRLALTVRIRGLQIGRHRLTVVAWDRAGNRASTTRSFARCAVQLAAPRFTG